MKTILKSVLAAALVATTTLTVGSLAEAHEYKLGNLHIDHPFARATAGPARAGAAYLRIENAGDNDRLIAASSDRAGKVELHSMEMTDGVMRMREVEGGVPVPANGNVALEPGGLHIMLMGLTQPLVEGERFPMTLTFEKAGTIEVEIAVEGVAAGADKHEGHHGHMEHDHDMDHDDDHGDDHDGGHHKH